MLERKCKVSSGTVLAALESEKREVLTKAFGQYGAESILLASAPGAMLWTDDNVQSTFARSEFGVRRVWTQIVIGSRVESGAVDPDVFSETSAKLLGFGYSFTIVNPQVLKQAARLGSWKPYNWALKQALMIFEDESIELHGCLQLVAGFLALFYQDSLLSDMQSAITVRILDHVVKRKGGLEGIRKLRSLLPQLFGVNVLGLTAAAKTMDAWLKTKGTDLLA